MAGATPPSDNLFSILSDQQRKQRRDAEAAARLSASQTGTAAFLSTTGTLSVTGAAYFVDAYNNPVTNTPVAAYLDGNAGNNRLGRTASSRRYKQDIKPMDIDLAAVMALQLVQFRWVQQVAEKGDAAGYDFGLIAEDVEALGLVPWVFHGEDGEPEGVHYDRLVLAVLPVVQWLCRTAETAEQDASTLKDQVAELTTRLTAAESRLATAEKAIKDMNDRLVEISVRKTTL